MQDFTANMGRPGINYAGIHLWPDNWLEVCTRPVTDVAGTSPNGSRQTQLQILWSVACTAEPAAVKKFTMSGVATTRMSSTQPSAGSKIRFVCVQTNPAFAEQWVSTHANVSAALGKPLIVEEVCVVTNGHPTDVCRRETLHGKTRLVSDTRCV